MPQTITIPIWRKCVGTCCGMFQISLDIQAYLLSRCLNPQTSPETRLSGVPNTDPHKVLGGFWMSRVYFFFQTRDIQSAMLDFWSGTKTRGTARQDIFKKDLGAFLLPKFAENETTNL